LTLPIPKTELLRLTKLCGMFGSAHAGERATAAAKADQLVRDLGLRWPDLLTPPTEASIEGQIGAALAHLDVLSAWERSFVHSINGRHQLSPKQQVVLERITKKIDAYQLARRTA
jgi:hypothetical protein